MSSSVAPVDQSIISPILIGRTQEFATLERVLSTAQEGKGQSLLIAGDAGVGKSRLLSELAKRATEQGCLVIAGRCFEQDAAFPYSLWIDALRHYVNANTQESIGDAF